jgi:acyl dehydratase
MSLVDRSARAGGWFSNGPTVIGPDAAGAFAQAIGEIEPAMLAGRVLTPTMAIVPAWEAEERALASALAPEALGHALHAEHAFEFLAPMRPCRALGARSRVAGVSAKRSGVLVTIDTEVLDGDTVVNRQHYAVFAVGATLPDQAAGQALPAVSPPKWVHPGELEKVGSLVESVDQRWAERYAHASGDFFEVHLSREYARALGYRSTILHGMCTFGIAARAVRELLGRRAGVRWLRLGVRFSAPVVLPARLETEVSLSPGGSAAGAAGAFITRDADRGIDVLTRGYFELA